MFDKIIRLLVAATILGGSGLANANLVLEGTRVVYLSSAKDTTLTIRNVGESPSLMQAWVDAGNPQESPENTETPFIITPPMVRIDPEQSQILRIIHSGQVLPTDRESLYWLNVMDIPPKSDVEKDQSYLQLAIRIRIKIFYRPAHLRAGADKAVDALKWRSVATDNGSVSLEADNPTPYHISVSGLTYVVNEKEYGNPLMGTIAPFSKQVFIVKDDKGAIPAAKAGAAVNFQNINDYGAYADKRMPVER